MLASIIIEDVRRSYDNPHENGVAFLYFTFSDQQKQSYNALLRALVAQLLGRRAINQALQVAYDAHKSSGSTTTVLERLVDAAVREFKQVHIVIDALDECPYIAGSRPDMFEALDHLAQAHRSVSILVTSRRESDIEDAMQSWDATQVPIDTMSVDGDIEMFVKSELEKGFAIRRLDLNSK